MNELILYSSNDGQTRLHLRVEGQSVWLSQSEIAELFQTTKQNVSLHAKNIFTDAELEPEATIKESLTVQTEGNRRIQRKLTHYNLDLILAIGYRVRSPRGVQFRQWASAHLKEFLQKGYLLDDERLKNPGGWDYFDELLARIREIRASEKRFYQKVRDLFSLSSDYRVQEQEGTHARTGPRECQIFHAVFKKQQAATQTYRRHEHRKVGIHRGGLLGKSDVEPAYRCDKKRHDGKHGGQQVALKHQGCPARYLTHEA
jgi:hypothetical protein